jgi:hypothetical protein
MNVKTVVKRMGELLYGESIHPAQAKKIETFLLTPGPAPGTPMPGGPGPGGPKGAPLTPTTPPTEGKSVEPAPPPGSKKEPPKKEPPKPLDPKDVKIDSPEFKARVREAFHALMCLPEYQLS